MFTLRKHLFLRYLKQWEPVLAELQELRPKVPLGENFADRWRTLILKESAIISEASENNPTRSVDEVIALMMVARLIYRERPGNSEVETDWPLRPAERILVRVIESITGREKLNIEIIEDGKFLGPTDYRNINSNNH